MNDNPDISNTATPLSAIDAFAVALKKAIRPTPIPWQTEAQRAFRYVFDAENTAEIMIGQAFGL